MTKPKLPAEIQKRGPKPGADQDGATWVAVEVRRRVDGVGRGKGTVSRAITFLQEDLTKAGYEVKVKTLHNRYYRPAGVLR